MSDYKRLTERTLKGNIKILAPNGHYYEAHTRNPDDLFFEILNSIIERLAELEDKIENGTMIELPCKEGTIVYYIAKECFRCPLSWADLTSADCEIGGECDNMIYGDECKKHFHICECAFTSNVRNCVWGTEFYQKKGAVDNYDSTFFLIREEAEEKLKEILEQQK